MTNKPENGAPSSGMKSRILTRTHLGWREVDGEWATERVASGLASGEGLIYHVRDRVERENKDGKREVVDEGVRDKRLLAYEAELAGLLKVMSRDGNNLSPVMRQA